MPTGSRRSAKPADVVSQTGDFVAEIGVGIVHHAQPSTEESVGEREVALMAAIKAEFDPTGRLNPGVRA